MVYIVCINPKGFEDLVDESVFDTLKEADEFMEQHANCNDCECDYCLYEAINEYTAKRRLIKSI